MLRNDQTRQNYAVSVALMVTWSGQGICLSHHEAMIMPESSILLTDKGIEGDHTATKKT